MCIAWLSVAPVQFPTKFELVVNLRTAKAMGLILSEGFLLRADELIEEAPRIHQALGGEVASPLVARA
jgi:hypothetical protein